MVTLAYVIVVAAGVGTSWREAGPLPRRTAQLHARVDRALEPFIAAALSGEVARIEELAATTGQSTRGRLLLVELHVTADVLRLVDLQQLGVIVARYGTTTVDVWIDPERLIAVAEAAPQLGTLRLPHRPAQAFGPTVSEGVAAIKADALQCADITGSGVAIADVDTSFDQFTQAQAAGEIGSVASTPAAGGNAHGTGTSEIIFDVAPGVLLYPLKVATLADLEAAINGLPTSVSIVSHSLTWTGFSFGDGTGPMCDLVDGVSARGVAFVTSAGNEAAGNFYAGEFTDSDANDIHEFAIGDEVNRLTVTGATSARIFLDWDAYPTTDIDYDLHVQQWNGSAWTTIGSSVRVQDGSVDPTEEVDIDLTQGPTYGVVVNRHSTATATRRLRIFVFPDDVVTLQYAKAAGSLVDPASCTGAITVGGVMVSGYSSGTPYNESSQGPTSDGRLKPDLVAPTGVTTSFGAFSGTSASTPHVAAAVALYMQAGSMTAAQAASALLTDAQALGAQTPNNQFGRGLLLLDPTRGGAVCQPQASEACTTTCGSTGVHTCNQHCGYGACVPPAEVCNGIDDDCDGVPDNGFACPAGQGVACPTTCGTTGTAQCDAVCSLGVCVPPKETCNGVDDDCDGVVDGPSVCVSTHVVSQSCQASDSSLLACLAALGGIGLLVIRRGVVPRG